MKFIIILLFIPFTAFGICGKIDIQNHTNSWTEHDKFILNLMKVRCEQTYPESPCLKVFIKKSDTLYNAICGEEQ